MLTPGGGTVVMARAVFDFVKSFDDVKVSNDRSESPGFTLPGTVTVATTSTFAPVAIVPVSGTPSPSVSGRGVIPSD